MPIDKAAAGYRHEPDKLRSAGLHGRTGDTVRAERIDDCPVNLEARVVHVRPLGTGDTDDSATFLFEAAITRVHVHDSIRAPGTADRIDPDRWRPLIMSFQRFYGLSAALHPSRLAGIDEEWYR